ncbi:hypothetical protein ACQR0Z_06025 [Bradyrhizobium sp. HKCCYLS3077]|uniref:hypothetical protein n=1 Tax=Bradyrhizobium sp. HKCCYLS3077 TaxID=3420761 RepID=UPI003EBEC66B
MIRPTILQVLIALAALVAGSQASWGQQASCSSAASLESNGSLPVTSERFDTPHQAGLCRRQATGASLVSFLTPLSDGRADRKMCVGTFAADPWSNTLSSVRP